jgi:anaerobic magnesium-protoporphyrin IX monomethyl ester cyclase
MWYLSGKNNWKENLFRMNLDAIIIADTGEDGLSRPNALNPPSLKLDKRSATVQAVLNYLENQGRIVPPIKNDGAMTWWSAPRYNGLFLSSHLIKQGFEVQLINKYYEQKDEFLIHLEQTPRAVIISTTFILTKHSLRKLIDDIRSSAPDIFIIVGGPFVYKSFLFLQRSHEQDYVTGSARDDFLFFSRNEPLADLYIISREGEDLLCEVLGRIQQNRPVDNMPNIAQFVDGEYIFTPFKDEVSNAGKAPVEWKSLPDSVFKSGVVPMQASGGCPYKCAYCTFRKDDRIIYLKPIEQLVEELKAVSNRGVRYVRFIDDNFRLGVPDLEGFCKRIIEEDIQIDWMTMIKINTLEKVDANLLRRSGCIDVALGLESTDPLVLRNMNKKANPATYRPVVQRLLKAGINCSCYFLLGFPGETDESAYRTRAFIKSIERLDLDGIFSWNIYSFCLYPLSPIYEPETREKYGLTGYLDDWIHDTMDSRRAGEHVREALLELDNSCPIYRGDNLDIIQGLTPQQRKSFFINRYRLGKKALTQEVARDDILAVFNNILAKTAKHSGKLLYAQDGPAEVSCQEIT